MPDDIKIKLVATGFPWWSLLFGIITLLVVTGAGLYFGFALEGVSVVAALSALAVFAMTLGWHVR